MKLIVGLGNIGAHYDGTRHNIGFQALENIAGKQNLDWHTKDKFKASIAEGELFGHQVICLKPNTYYNLSGEAVRAVKDFYKLENSDILVIHDELDLPFGTIRARIGGTDAGNNGIKNIIAQLGDDFARLRVGIANHQLEVIDPVDFVLSRFTHEEHGQLELLLANITDLTVSFVDENRKFEHTSVRLNTIWEG